MGQTLQESVSQLATNWERISALPGRKDLAMKNTLAKCALQLRQALTEESIWHLIHINGGLLICCGRPMSSISLQDEFTTIPARATCGR